MKLTLTTDDGVVMDSWYIPDEEIAQRTVMNRIDDIFPTYTDREEYVGVLADYAQEKSKS